MNEADRIRLLHMRDAAREALSFARGRTLEDLSSDRLLLLGLVKEIEIVGEAASQVTAPVREAAPEIPWPQIIGMRHRLIHAYADVNVHIVWSTIVSDLPELLAKLDTILGPDDNLY